MNSLQSQPNKAQISEVSATRAQVRLLEGYPTTSEIRQYLAKTFQMPVLLKEHLDVWVAEPDLKSGNYSIDFIRQLLEFGALAPHELPFKMIVFTKAHLLGELGMNVLLKILEEPPSHLYFILTAPERSLFLSTLTSRIELIEPWKKNGEALKETSPEKKLYNFLSDNKVLDFAECLAIAEHLGEESFNWENFFGYAWQLLDTLKIPPSIQLKWLDELKEGERIHIKDRNLILAFLFKIRAFTDDQKTKQEWIASIEQ